MKSNVIYVEVDSKLMTLIRATTSYKQALEELLSISYDIPELGIRWPLNDEYEELLHNIPKLPTKDQFLMIVVDQKRWMLTKIKYGI